MLPKFGYHMPSSKPLAGLGWGGIDDAIINHVKLLTSKPEIPIGNWTETVKLEASNSITKNISLSTESYLKCTAQKVVCSLQPRLKALEHRNGRSIQKKTVFNDRRAIVHVHGLKMLNLNVKIV